MIRAVFFDLDGTLCNCADLHYEALNRAMEECGFPGIGRPEHLAVFNGLPTKAKLRLLEQQGRIEAVRSAEIEALKQQYTLELAHAHVRPDPVKVEMCRELAISDATYYKWRREYGGMQISQAKRLKELEVENTRLKRAVADLTLNNQILKDVASGNF